MESEQSAKDFETVEAIELSENDRERQGRLVEVAVTDAELTALDALGPESSEVQQWLAENGITEHDTIVANGKAYTARAEDFLTRDAAATEALAVASAKSLLELENRMDDRTAELAEHEPRVSREEAEKIGEEAVEDAEIVKDPSAVDGSESREVQDALSPSEYRYTELVHGALDGFSSEAGERAERMNQSVGHFERFSELVNHLETEANESLRLRHAYETRPDKAPADLIALYEARQNTLYGMKTAFKNIVDGAGYLDDFDKSISALEGIFEDKTHELEQIDASYKAATDSETVPVVGITSDEFKHDVEEIKSTESAAKSALKTVESAYVETVSRELDEAIRILEESLRRVQAGEPYAEGFDRVASILAEAAATVRQQCDFDQLADDAKKYVAAVSALVIKTQYHS